MHDGVPWVLYRGRGCVKNLQSGSCVYYCIRRLEASKFAGRRCTGSLDGVGCFVRDFNYQFNINVEANCKEGDYSE